MDWKQILQILNDAPFYNFRVRPNLRDEPTVTSHLAKRGTFIALATNSALENMPMIIANHTKTTKYFHLNKTEMKSIKNKESTDITT